MNKLIKTAITLTAIGVAVKVGKKQIQADDFSHWIILSRNREEGFEQMIQFLKNKKRIYIAHEWLDDKIIIYSKAKLIS